MFEINSTFLAYLRLFEYLLVILAGLALVYKKKHLLCISNVLVAIALLHNSINYLTGEPNSYAFQVMFTIVAGIWAVAHVFELLRKV